MLRSNLARKGFPALLAQGLLSPLQGSDGFLRCASSSRTASRRVLPPQGSNNLPDRSPR